MELNPTNANLDRSSSEPWAQLPLQAQTVGGLFATVVENIAEAFFALDATGRCTYLNTTAEQLFGITRTDLLGKALWDIFQVDPLSQLCQLCQQAITKQLLSVEFEPVKFEEFYPSLNRWFTVRLFPIPDGLAAYFLDITERKETKSALQKQQELLKAQLDAQLDSAQAERNPPDPREQSKPLTSVAQWSAKEPEQAQSRSAFLVAVSEVLASSLDYEQTLQSVTQLAVPYFADWCAVDLLNEDGSISRVAVAHSDPEKVQFGWKLAHRFPRHLNDGYGISQVMRTGQSEIAIAISDEQLAAAVSNPEYLEILCGLGLKSAIVAPLRARGRVLGSISFVFAESDRHYSMGDLELAEDLARRAAIAIDNAHLYHTAQQAKHAAETAADRTARLQTVTAALSESLTPEQVAEVIVEQSMATLEATAALVVLVSKDRTELEIVKSVGYAEDLVKSWRRFSIDTDVPLAEAIRTGEPAWMESFIDRISRYPHLASVYRRYDFESWMALPLVVEGISVGGLLLSFKEFRNPSQDDRNFVLALSRQCAQAIFRAQLYEAERNARAEAEQANQVKDEFLAVLSHELRSPLNPILGWSKLLRTQKLPPEKVDQALATVERNAKLQAQLIEDLLDISRMLRGKLSLNIAPVDLTTVIQGAIETVQLAASTKFIQIETVLQSPKKTLLGDANRLQQVVWNLLSNAVKFTPYEGQIKIQLEDLNDQIQIRVTDNGKGIDPDFLPHMFEYFRQADSSTSRQFGGLGLGLAIARQIVELHGGTIQAESRGEGLGATFIVCLPVATVAPESFIVPESLTQAVNLAGLQILVVDDEADMLSLAEFVLSQQGAQVTVAHSAAEALLKLSQSIPDVLLCDIGMPEMDGYTLMRQIRARSPEAGGTISAIALTAYAGEYDRRQALAAGFQYHVSKPVAPEELVKAIVQAVKQR
ncbi:ATP-binding protein [Leptolyngbya ohadii]|uniref:ATP-binding protein n=1 Tax=Leptolyngbya ohadii TaxID=1962290 RepID=UPI000B5A114A|nr:ATP-binding protein [Leptolyngbya ohadii]